jgi:hypothetical protein
VRPISKIQLHDDTEENNPLVWQETHTFNVTARTIGVQLACDNADKQAAILAWWADEVAKYGPLESWPKQCRMIAECLSDAECAAVRSLLESITEHLDAIPIERRAARITGNICAGIVEAISDTSTPPSHFVPPAAPGVSP